jgi:hypothetical protein
MKRLGNERGIALAVAIFALVVIGGLVAGSIFVATQEQRIGRNTLRQQTAFTAAESGTQDVVLNWAPRTYNKMAVGGYITTTATAADGKGWYRRTVQRLGQNAFMVRTDGFNQDSTARQRVGVLLRLKPLAFNITAALKTAGSLKIGGSSYINGQDTPPTGWAGCPASQPTLPGIQIPNPANIQTSGCSNMSCVNGNPQVLQDTSITVQKLLTVGGIPFDSLKSLASKIVPGGNLPMTHPSYLGTTCNTDDPNNWGDGITPTSPCGDYFPIIWADASTSLQGVQGQGVLIVNGDLSVTGGFQFFGPVIVKGTVSTAGTGGHFNGGVISANVNLAQNTVLGAAVINFSSCALLRSLTSSATVGVMRERSWVNLYDHE